MKKIVYSIFVVVICTACKASYNSANIDFGRFCFYYSKEKNQKDELVLKSDSTFNLTLYGGGYKPSCRGKWYFVDKNIIRVECFSDENPLASITSGYMSLRTRDIEVINPSKLKMPITNNVKRKYVILEKED